MIRVTSFLHLEPDLDDTVLDDLLEILRAAPHRMEQTGLLAYHISPTAAVTVGGGQIMALMAFSNLASYQAARRHFYTVNVIQPALSRSLDHIETVCYCQGPVVLKDPAITNGIQRT